MKCSFGSWRAAARPAAGSHAVDNQTAWAMTPAPLRFSAWSSWPRPSSMWCISLAGRRMTGTVIMHTAARRSADPAGRGGRRRVVLAVGPKLAAQPGAAQETSTTAASRGRPPASAAGGSPVPGCGGSGGGARPAATTYGFTEAANRRRGTAAARAAGGAAAWSATGAARLPLLAASHDTIGAQAEER